MTVRHIGVGDRPESLSALSELCAVKPTLEDFTIGKTIGEGNCSRIVEAQYRGGEKVALKVVEKAAIQRLRRRHPNLQRELVTERDILNKLSHPNIIQLYNTFQDESCLYYALELIEGGELWEYLWRQSYSVMARNPLPGMWNGDAVGALRRIDPAEPCNSWGCDEPMAQLYAADIVRAIEYMQSQGIGHRDLKPENLLIGPTGHLKLIDFATAMDIGCARKPSNSHSSFVGTPEYMAPEVIEGRQQTTDVDLYSLGSIVYQMLTGIPPFKAKGVYPSLIRAQRALYYIPSFLSEQAQSLIRGLLKLKPHRRLGSQVLGINSLKDHPFFDGVNWAAHSTSAPPLRRLVDMCIDAVTSSLANSERHHESGALDSSKCCPSLPLRDLRILPRRQRLQLAWRLHQFGLLGRPEVRQGLFRWPNLCTAMFQEGITAPSTTGSLASESHKILLVLNLQFEVTVLPDGHCHIQSGQGDRLRHILCKIKEEKPSVILFGGDIFKSKAVSAGFDKLLSAFNDALGGLDGSIDMFFVRSENTGDFAEYNSIFGDSFYSFSVGPVRYVILDTIEIASPLGTSRAQKDWLSILVEEARLREETLVVLGHHLPGAQDYSECTASATARLNEKTSQALLQLLAKAKVPQYISTGARSLPGSKSWQATTVSMFGPPRRGEEMSESTGEHSLNIFVPQTFIDENALRRVSKDSKRREEKRCQLAEIVYDRGGFRTNDLHYLT